MDIFYWALQKGEFKSFLNKDSALPMMYMPDCLKATTMLLEAPTEALKQRCVAKTLSCSPSIINRSAVNAYAHSRTCYVRMAPRRTYNVTAISFTPEELAAAIKKRIPNFSITYEPGTSPPG